MILGGNAMKIVYLAAVISLQLVGCQNGYTEKSNEGINDMHSDWNEAYDEFLNDIEKDASVVCKEIDYNESKSTCINIHMDDEHCADPGSYIGYRLCDVNQDDIPELFVEIYGCEANHHVHIYTWKEKSQS